MVFLCPLITVKCGCGFYELPTLISFDISHPHLIFISRFHVVLLSDIPRVLGQTDATTNKILETIMHPLKGLGT